MKATLAKRPPRTARIGDGHNSRASEPQRLARVVLEARASPEPAFAWLMHRDPVSRLLAIRVLHADERAHFPECRGRA